MIILIRNVWHLNSIQCHHHQLFRIPIQIVNHHLQHYIVMMKSVFDEQCINYYHVIIIMIPRYRLMIMMMFIHLFHLHLSFILHYHSKTIMLNLQVIGLISFFYLDIICILHRWIITWMVIIELWCKKYFYTSISSTT